MKYKYTLHKYNANLLYIYIPMGALFIVTSHYAGWLYVHCCSSMNDYYTGTCVATYIILISSKPCSENLCMELLCSYLNCVMGINNYLCIMSKLHSCISKGEQTVACLLAGINLHFSM